MRNKKDYPEEWADVIRPAILKRDNFKCQHCGIKHRVYIFIDQNGKRIVVDRKEHEELKAGGYKTYRIFLQVAHKNNVKSDCGEGNLISLCNDCHYRMDKEWRAIVRISNISTRASR